jgi:hypothetical protein
VNDSKSNIGSKYKEAQFMLLTNPQKRRRRSRRRTRRRKRKITATEGTI